MCKLKASKKKNLSDIFFIQGFDWIANFTIVDIDVNFIDIMI